VSHTLCLQVLAIDDALRCDLVRDRYTCLPMLGVVMQLVRAMLLLLVETLTLARQAKEAAMRAAAPCDDVSLLDRSVQVSARVIVCAVK
jgi:hypothetical protein